MTMDEMIEIKHFGVLGMKWGKRKAARQAEAVKIRNKGLDRINKNRQGVELIALYGARGQKATNRVLTIMGKDKTKTLQSAANKQLGESIAKRVLVVAGASIAGGLLSAATS